MGVLKIVIEALWEVTRKVGDKDSARYCLVVFVNELQRRLTMLEDEQRKNAG